MYQSATHDFLLTFYSKHGPILHHFRDRWRFQLKIANFSHPRVFNTPLKGFPLELGYGCKGSKKLEWWGYQMVKMFWYRFSHWDRIPARDRQMDGQTLQSIAWVKVLKLGSPKKPMTMRQFGVAMILIPRC